MDSNKPARINHEERESPLMMNIQMAAIIPTGAAFLAATLVSPIIFDDVLMKGLSSSGPASSFMTLAAGLAVTAIGSAAIVNLTLKDLKNAGTAVKNFGQALVEGVSDLGRSMGLLDKDQSPLSKIAEEPVKNRSYWATTAVDSARLMLVSPLLYTTVTAVVGAIGVPFAGQGNYAAAAMMVGAMGAVSAATIGAQFGLSKLRNNLQSNEKFADAASSAEPEKPSPGNNRSIDSDYGLQP